MTMPALDLELFGNTLLRWAIAFATAAGAFVLFLAIKRAVLSRLEAFAARTETQLDDLFVDLVRRTRRWMVLPAMLYLGTRVVVLHPRIERLIEVLAIVGLVFQVGFWTMALVDSWIERYRRERLGADPGAAGTLNAVGFVAKFGLWTVILLLGLSNLGVDVTAVVTGLGVGGIAVALATQNVLGDLFSSLSIVVDKPFVVGDTIAVNELVGSVEQIGLKTTRVRALTGEQIVFSNTDLLKSRIRNLQRIVERRALLVFGLRYDTSAELLAQVPSMVREAVASEDRLRFDRAHFRGFGPSSLDFEAVYWVMSADYAVFMDLQQAVNLELVRRFEAVGIGFAFPTQTLHVESLPPSVTTG